MAHPKMQGLTQARASDLNRHRWNRKKGSQSNLLNAVWLWESHLTSLASVFSCLNGSLLSISIKTSLYQFTGDLTKSDKSHKEICSPEKS